MVSIRQLANNIVWLHLFGLEETCCLKKITSGYNYNTSKIKSIEISIYHERIENIKRYDAVYNNYKGSHQ